MCFPVLALSRLKAQDSCVLGLADCMTARLDAIDRKILEAVQGDGRISNVDLAARIHLSAPQTFRRVRSLEERGVIRGYRAEVAPEAIGYAVTAYVSVSIGGNDFGRVREVEAEIRAF